MMLAEEEQEVHFGRLVAVTVAVLVRVPAIPAMVVAAMCTLRMPPGARSPNKQVSLPPAMVQPVTAGVMAHTRPGLAGRGSVSLTPFAFSVPVLLRVMVNPTLSPVVTGVASTA